MPFNDIVVCDDEDIEELGEVCMDCDSLLQTIDNDQGSVRCGVRDDAPFCVNCCGCPHCNHCGTHISDRTTQHYVEGLLGIPYNVFLQRLGASFGISAWGTSAPISELMEEDVSLYCSQHARNSWLSREVVQKSKKIELTEYVEDDNDRTVVGKQEKFNSTSVMKFGSMPVTFLPSTVCDRYPSPTYVGCELEAESGGSKELEALVHKWKGCLVPDGSVSAGYEIRTAPAYGATFCEMIEQITAEARKSSSLVNHKCGLHVHVDMRDTKIEHMFNFAFFWSLFEMQLFAMQPASRRGIGKEATGFCKPLSTRWRVMQVLDKPEYTIDHNLGFLLTGKMAKFSKIIAEGGGGDRYHAFNMDSFRRHKTVEIRLAAGTLLPEKIVPWAVICVALRDAACALSRDEILKIANSDKPVRQKLLDLLPTEEARNFVITRQKKFDELGLNTEENLAKVFDPTRIYQSYVPN